MDSGIATSSEARSGNCASECLCASRVLPAAIGIAAPANSIRRRELLRGGVSRASAFGRVEPRSIGHRTSPVPSVAPWTLAVVERANQFGTTTRRPGCATAEWAREDWRMATESWVRHRTSSHRRFGSPVVLSIVPSQLSRATVRRSSADTRYSALRVFDGAA